MTLAYLSISYILKMLTIGMANVASLSNVVISY